MYFKDKFKRFFFKNGEVIFSKRLFFNLMQTKDNKNVSCRQKRRRKRHFYSLRIKSRTIT